MDSVQLRPDRKRDTFEAKTPFGCSEIRAELNIHDFGNIFEARGVTPTRTTFRSGRERASGARGVRSAGPDTPR